MRPLRLLLIGDGTGTIPPTKRGAVQTIIWAYSERLRARGHHVDILNARAFHLLWRLPPHLKNRYDFVWTNHDRSTIWARRYVGRRLVHLSHRPVTDPDGMDQYGARILRTAAKAAHHLCLTPEIMLVNKVLNPKCRVALAPNAVEVSDFRVAASGSGAICVGGVSRRKRQRDVLASGVECDFVGPLDHDDEETRIVAESPQYLGEWRREEVQTKLTGYAVLVLFSRAEAQPLVVGEAFAAGLSVVLSPESARNVDPSLPFVTIVRDAAEIPAAVAEAEARNAELRPLIRAHAERAWDWDPRVAAVEAQLLAWRDGESYRPPRR